MSDITTLSEAVKLVNLTLHEAANYGLMNEVIASSLKSLKKNPDHTIKEALDEGKNEWIK